MSLRMTRRRRGRRCVLTALGAFVLSQLALAIAVETVCPTIRSPAFGSRLAVLQDRIASAPEANLVIAFGSSRVETGLQPAAFADGDESVIPFNFGLAGSAPLNIWLTMRHLESLGIRPERIILEVMPAWLVESRPHEQCVFAEQLTLADLLRLAPECGDSRQLWMRWLEARALPIHSGRFAIVSRFAPRWLTWETRKDYLWANLDRCGANRLPNSFDAPDWRERGIERARSEYSERLSQFRIDELPATMIRRILADCRKRRVPVLLLVMPEAGSFQAMYPADANRSISNFLAGLRRDYGCSLIDARSWLPERAFLDGHHLLESGAVEFSARLARETRAWRAAGR